ncbi:MAG: 4Fe-4S dicluster domain-containing protein [Desulfobacterales bacterium]
MKVIRKIIQIDEALCDGCGNCVPACAEGAIEIVDGKARVVADIYCDGLGACLGECPRGALALVEREAEEFDEHAVEKRLAARSGAEAPPAAPAGRIFPLAGEGCPSRRMVRAFDTASAAAPEAGEAAGSGGEESALSHWPVQILLVPPEAPFLRGADLLVMADCVPVAFPSLHRDLLRGRRVMIGCPKFDDREAYVEKFSRVFREAGIRRVTCVTMEVPCCGGLPQIVRQGLKRSGAEIPLEEVVISVRGKILERKPAA